MKINAQSVISFFMKELEGQRDRLFLWAPVFLGIGILSYFQEWVQMDWRSATALGGAFVALILVTGTSYRKTGEWKWFISLLIISAVTLILIGYSLAGYRDQAVGTILLERDLPSTMIEADIESLTLLEGGKAKRIVLNNIEFDDDKYQKWDGVRVRLKSYHFKGDEWQVGDRIRIKAKLLAPGKPVIPDGFDFRTKAYFEGLSAVGYTLADAELSVRGSDQALSLFGQFKHAIVDQIQSSMSPRYGAIAQALLVGDRAGIIEDDSQALRDSGLAHLLAISGLHIGLVAGCVFFFLRLFLACIPYVALHYPIKKWAAICAIIVAFAYMILAGATVPTIRAFIMTGLVLFAIVLDRSALNMRLVALAAIVIMVMTPEAIMGPSFVLSFAAVAALITFYQEFGRKWLVSAQGYRGAWRPIYYLFGIILTSLIATLATAPFAILFFNRFAMYGVLSNILAMPLMSFVVMPFGLIAVFLMPFGLGEYGFSVMEWGIEHIVMVAHAIAIYDGAVSTWPTMSSFSVGLIVGGFIWLVLWRGHARWLGAVVIILCFAVSGGGQKRHIVIAEDMSGIMIHGGDDQNITILGKVNAYTKRNWLGALGYDELQPIQSYEPDYCDDFYCQVNFAGKQTVIVKNPIVIQSVCSDADILIADIPVDDDVCDHPERIIDRFYVWRHGATTIEYTDNGYQIKTVQ